MHDRPKMTDAEREAQRRKMIATALAHPMAPKIAERIRRQDRRDARREIARLERKEGGDTLTWLEAMNLDSLRAFVADNTPTI